VVTICDPKGSPERGRADERTREAQVMPGVGPRFRPLCAAAALTLLGGTPACSGDDTSSADTTSTSSSTTTTTHPPATDEAAAFPIVEELVHEATDLTDELYQDPAVVDEPENDDIARLRELYTADNPTPDGVVQNLQELSDQDRQIRAASSGIFRDLYLYDITATDENTVHFGFCALQDQETVDTDGNVVEHFAEVTQGEGEARREENIWRFYGLDRDDERSTEIRPGTAVAGFCESIYEQRDAAS
jgi:hypothetical protein